MKILVVEDEQKLANAIRRGLRQERYAVDVENDGDSGYAAAVADDYDVILLDRMLPGDMNGIDICTRLRREGVTTPILMLTAKGQISDKVTGLDAGADDYLVKPFSFEELLARLRALMRRPQDTGGTVLDVDGLTLDTASYVVKRGEKLITLSNTEFALLEYMMRNSGRTLSKTNIISHVWDFDADVLPNTVEAYIGYLRAKIDKPFPDKDNLLHTVRGFGYRIGAP